MVILLIAMLSVSCGKDDLPVSGEGQSELISLVEGSALPVPHKTCTIEHREDGTYLICDDGSVEKFSSNFYGEDGVICQIIDFPDYVMIECSDGTSTRVDKGETIEVETTPGSGEDSGSGEEESGDDENDDDGDNDQDNEDSEEDGIQCPREITQVRRECIKKCHADFSANKQKEERKDCKKSCHKKFKKAKKLRKWLKENKGIAIKRYCTIKIIKHKQVKIKCKVTRYN